MPQTGSRAQTQDPHRSWGNLGASRQLLSRPPGSALAKSRDLSKTQGPPVKLGSGLAPISGLSWTFRGRPHCLPSPRQASVSTRQPCWAQLPPACRRCELQGPVETPALLGPSRLFPGIWALAAESLRGGREGGGLLLCPWNCLPCFAPWARVRPVRRPEKPPCLINAWDRDAARASLLYGPGTISRMGRRPGASRNCVQCVKVLSILH